MAYWHRPMTPRSPRASARVAPLTATPGELLDALTPPVSEAELDLHWAESASSAPLPVEAVRTARLIAVRTALSARTR